MTSKAKRSHWLGGKGRVDAMLCFDGTFADSLRHAPREVLQRMTCYKFAARMIGTHKRVLDIGCAEGLGTSLLAVECGNACGVDLDPRAIASARTNWRRAGIRFVCGDIFERGRSAYDGVVCIDNGGLFSERRLGRLIKVLARSLTSDGVAVVGLPFIPLGQLGDRRKGVASQAQSAGRCLECELLIHFQYVFLFSAWGGIVQPGFHPFADYAIMVACIKRAAERCDKRNGTE